MRVPTLLSIQSCSIPQFKTWSCAIARRVFRPPMGLRINKAWASGERQSPILDQVLSITICREMPLLMTPLKPSRVFPYPLPWFPMILISIIACIPPSPSHDDYNISLLQIISQIALTLSRSCPAFRDHLMPSLSGANVITNPRLHEKRILPKYVFE